MINRVVVWIVFEYMKKMGLPNMLFFIAHHFDKEHPHVHITLIVLLMMAELSQGKRKWLRCVHLCKELTEKNCL